MYMYITEPGLNTHTRTHARTHREYYCLYIIVPHTTFLTSPKTQFLALCKLKIPKQTSLLVNSKDQLNTTERGISSGSARFVKIEQKQSLRTEVHLFEILTCYPFISTINHHGPIVSNQMEEFIRIQRVNGHLGEVYVD